MLRKSGSKIIDIAYASVWRELKNYYRFFTVIRLLQHKEAILSLSPGAGLLAWRIIKRYDNS